MQNLQALCFRHSDQHNTSSHWKNCIANIKVCGEYWFQFAFSHDFFYWILVAVNPNFNCLMQCCSVSYSVTLVQIEQKLRKLQPVQCPSRQNSPWQLHHEFFFFYTIYFLIITTAAWIMQIIIKLTSDYIVFKFDGSMLKTCRFTRLQKCSVATVLSLRPLSRSPRGSFDMRIMPITWGYNWRT